MAGVPCKHAHAIQMKMNSDNGIDYEPGQGFVELPNPAPPVNFQKSVFLEIQPTEEDTQEVSKVTRICERVVTCSNRLQHFKANFQRKNDSCFNEQEVSKMEKTLEDIEILIKSLEISGGGQPGNLVLRDGIRPGHSRAIAQPRHQIKKVAFLFLAEM